MPPITTGKIELSPVEFIWQVNIHKLPKNVENSLASPKFSIDLKSNSVQWQLLLFHNDHSKNEKQVSEAHLSLFLKYHGSTDIKISFTLALINLNNEKKFEISCKKNRFFKKDVRSGWPKFCSISDLFNPNNNLLKNNIITISCIIKKEDSNLSSSKIDKIRDMRITEFDEFQKLLDKKDYSDVVLKAGKKSFCVHKNILAIRSPIFANIIKKYMKNEEKIIEVDDVKPEVMQELIKFIYTGKIGNILEIVCELLAAADYYKISGLKALCENTMCENLTEKNALEYLRVAKTHNANTAKTGTIKWISSHAEIFLKKSKFKEFGLSNPDIMYEIMRSLKDISTSEEESEDDNEPEKKKVRKE